MQMRVRLVQLPLWPLLAGKIERCMGSAPGANRSRACMIIDKLLQPLFKNPG